MKKTLVSIVISILSFQTIAFCQNENPVITNAVSKLKTMLTDHVIEKAYLHFDRPYAFYVAGESVYFKAYVTMGERHEPSAISGILHVDLIGKNDAIMKSLVLQLNNGTGWGDIQLPDTLQKGSYRIRAYTEWMRNEKVPNFFEQYISVSSVNNVDRVSEAVKQGNQPSLQFFPEGGNLVADIHSKVAFKAIGPDGFGMNVKGMVFDNEGKAVAKVTSTHVGMGVFDFIPEAGRAYKAKITFANGSQSAVDLPAIEAKGITLDVINTDPNKISIEINANRDYYKENQNKDLNMIVYCAGKVRTYSFKLDNEVLGLDLPIKDFPTGTLQVTLLSATGEPMNERLVFIRNSDQLNLSVTANKASFAKHENVQISLNAKTNEGMPVNGNFSVSVIDESKVLVDEDSENTILSYLLLTSDLKGYIEKPNYYFAHDSKETRADLDALMLTQGYRRFVWKQLLNDNSTTTATFMPEKHKDIAGVLKTKSGEPIANSSILLIEKAGGKTLMQQTDAQGRFNFANMDFLSDTRFLLKMQSNFGKNGAVLTLDQPSQGPAVAAANPIEAKYNANADILASLQSNQGLGLFTASNESTKVLLQNDKSIDNTSNGKNYRSTKLGGTGGADQVITADQILTGPSLSENLKGIARGIDFKNGQPVLQSSQVVTAGKVGAESMLIIVDGSVANSIDDVTPTDVETIEILKGPNASIYGVRGAAGVFVINTKQTGTQISSSKEMSPGLFSVIPTGFYKAREFYSPRYDASQPGNQLPDTRTTIFWKPDAATDANGNISFNYFNADGAGTYRVEVEGIDSKGNLGRQVYRYKVQ
ncbi:MAG TPA: TonB-dependent receptor plug domain-containing protein [Mucilaginibacter sp.]|jgi:TonB-dependent SusC/RagA subfamily outer membrane receptor